MNQETSISDDRRRLIFFLIMTLMGAVALIVYSCLTGNDNQTFTDIISEFTSENGTNKSAERMLFYAFPIIGSLIYAAWYFTRKWSNDSAIITIANNDSLFFIGLVVSYLVNIIIYKNNSWMVAAAIVLGILVKIKDLPNENLPLALYFLLIYAQCGLYRAYVFVGGRSSVNINLIIAIAALVTAVFVLAFNNAKLMARAALVTQLFIPFSLLIFLSSQYLTQDGSYTTIEVSKRIKLFIGIIIIAFLIEAVLKIKERWFVAASLQDVLTFGACVAIMSFNRYSGTGSIADFDLHHHFENIIGFSQIFELGQSPFSEYVPVSGMYSVAHGFILWLFGSGWATYYFVTTNIFYLFIIAAIVYLVGKQLKAEWVLFISLFLLVKDYNRIALIVPVILLLTLPQLIDNKNLWLKAWFLSSFVHGLYYPVFGAAVCIGFMPLGIWQIISYSKSGQLKKDIKTIKFWAWWIVCFIPVIASIPLLLGTLKHMLAMGSQTVLADGITRFGQTLPDNFLSYVGSEPVRIIAYLLCSYLPIIATIWLSIALFLKCGKVSFENKRIRIEKPVPGFIALSISLMFLVAFSFTIIRFDVADLYSRSDGIVKGAFVVLLIIAVRYIKNNNKNLKWIFAFAVFLVSISATEAFASIDTNEKLDAAYTVPAEDIFVQDGNVRLGECFINADYYTYITNTKNYVDTLDSNQAYLGISDSFGLYYLCNVKGSSVMEIFNTLKGYDAVEETVDILKDTRAIVGRNLNVDSNYYLYHWLLTSGQYVWNNDLRVFVPNDGQYTKEEVIELHKNLDLAYSDSNQLGRTPGSWGSSMDSLEEIFTEYVMDYELIEEGNSTKVDFAQEIDGDQADFIYIDFGDLTTDYKYIMYGINGTSVDIDATSYGWAKSLLRKDYNPDTVVTLTWTNDAGQEYDIYCAMDEGKLLIPIGSGTGWLLNSHSSFTIRITENGNEVTVPAINDIRFLKLREVQ